MKNISQGVSKAGNFTRKSKNMLLTPKRDKENNSTFSRFYKITIENINSNRQKNTKIPKITEHTIIWKNVTKPLKIYRSYPTNTGKLSLTTNT